MPGGWPRASPADMAVETFEDPTRPLSKKKDVTFGLIILLSGLVLLILGATLSRKSAYGTLSTGQIVFSVLAVFAAIVGTSWAADKHSKLKKQIAAARGGGGGAGEAALPPQMMQGGMPPQEAAGNRDVIRLCMIVADISETIIPVWDEFEFEDGELIGYGFRSMKPGFLATDSAKARVDAQLSSTLGDGWGISYNSREDSFTGSRKSDVPKLALPEMWRVVGSKAEAAHNFDDFEVQVGIGANGPISFKPKSHPHRLESGSTGGGKSVATRAEIMQYLAAGYRVFALDGKGTDYSSFMRFQNVSAVSTNVYEHVIVLHKVWLILQNRRLSAGAASKRGDTSWRETMTPILLVMDEFASVRNNIRAAFSTADQKLIDRDISDILKVGREFRVNVILATQDLKANTVDSDWLDMFIAIHSLGRPAPMTVNKAFPEEIRGEVTRLGQRISRKVPGRALVAVTDENGSNTAELYQAFWSYSPAETISEKLPAEVRENWSKFKTTVADRIPRLYPREWVKLEYPEPAEKKDPYADYREDGWVDITKMSVKDLHELKPVPLEDPQTLEPLPENAIYDPLSDSYIGEAPLGSGDGFEVIDS